MKNLNYNKNKEKKIKKINMKPYFVARYLMFLFIVYVSLLIGSSQTFTVNVNLPKDSMMRVNDFQNEFSLEAALNSELNEYRDKLNKKYKATFYDEEIEDVNRKREKYDEELDDNDDDGDDDDNNENYKSQYDEDDDNDNGNEYSSSSKVKIKEDIIRTDDDYIIAKRRLMSRDYPIPNFMKSKLIRTLKPSGRMNAYSQLHIKGSTGQPPFTTYETDPNLANAECQKAKCPTRATFLGTNLFGPRRKKCFFTEDLALLSARYEFETIIPKSYPPGLATNKDVCLLLQYFNLINAHIERVDEEKSQRVIQRAFLDTLGAYLQYYLVPNVKLSFYAGRLSLCAAKKVIKIYHECKIALNTNGNGWKKSKINVFTDEILNTIKPLRVKPLNASVGITSCSLLDLRSGPKDGMQQKLLVALPKLEPMAENENHLGNVCLPFDKRRVFNLLSPKCAFIFVKFYKILTYCHRYQRISMGNYNYKLYIWIEKKLRDHLCDDEFYPGLGGILNIYMTAKLCKKKMDYADELRESGNKDQDYDSADMDFPVKEPISIGIWDRAKHTRSIGINNVAAVNTRPKVGSAEPGECPCPSGLSYPCEVLGLIKSTDKKTDDKKSSIEYSPRTPERDITTTEEEIDIDDKNIPYITKTLQAAASDDEEAEEEEEDESPIWDFINDNRNVIIAIGVAISSLLLLCICICCCCFCCTKKTQNKDQKEEVGGEQYRSEDIEPQEDQQKKEPVKNFPQPVTKPFWGLFHSRRRSRHVLRAIKEQAAAKNTETTSASTSRKLSTAGAMHFTNKEKMPNFRNIKKERTGKKNPNDYDDLTTMTSSTDLTTRPERKYISKTLFNKKVTPDNRSYYFAIDKVGTEPTMSQSKTVVDSTTLPPKSIIKRFDSPTKNQPTMKLTKSLRKAQKAKEISQSAKHLADLSELSKPPPIFIPSSSDPNVKKHVSTSRVKRFFKRQKAGMDDDFKGRNDNDWETTYSSNSNLS